MTSKGHGGRRYLPYAFTEQGIAILSAVLKSDVAIQVSIHIMNAFVEIRHFIANNALMFERISAIELRKLEFQKEANEKFDQVFEYKKLRRSFFPDAEDGALGASGACLAPTEPKARLNPALRSKAWVQVPFHKKMDRTFVRSIFMRKMGLEK